LYIGAPGGPILSKEISARLKLAVAGSQAVGDAAGMVELLGITATFTRS
jgi:hypothetical protein